VDGGAVEAVKFAATFPGQGSQSLGMLATLADSCDEVEATFAEASDVLGYDLWRLCRQGPEARLNATEQTQPAMLSADVAVWRCWRARGGPLPSVAAGHSLGEFAALVSAGSIEFGEAVALVAARGRFMQEAVPEGRGGIAALLGLSDKRVEEVCRKVCAESGGSVDPVNYNAPGQVVIAGHAEAVERALSEARTAGARRALRLPMSVPVHCELMRPAAERLRDRIADCAWRAPAFPILHNADLSEHHDVAGMVGALVAQLVAPVRWADTVHALAAHGAGSLIELGPGKVLTGLARRIDRDLNAFSVFDVAGIDGALERIAKA